MTHEWLIIFLVSVDLEDSSNKGINNIVQANLTNQFNKEIIDKLTGLDTGKDIKVVLINNVRIFSKTTTTVTSENALFELKDGSLLPIEYESINSMQPQDIDSLLPLLSFINTTFSSKRVIISPYGHGAMFGIFATKHIKVDGVTYTNKHGQKNLNEISGYLDKAVPEDFEIHQRVVASKPAATKYSYKLFSKQYQVEILVDPESGEKFEPFKMLSNEELAGVMKAAFNRKIDFLLFNNCVMQNIYAQYSYQGYVEYLIAPSTGIVYPCFNLKSIIEFIRDNPSKSNPEIAEFMVNSFQQQYYETNEWAKYNKVIREFIVLAICLDKVSGFLSLVEKTKDYLAIGLNSSNKTALAVAIANALQETYPMEYNTFTGETIFDLLQLLHSDYLAGYPDLQHIKTQMMDEANKPHLLYAYTGNTAYNAGYTNYFTDKPNIPVSGLCVYLPKKKHNSVLIKYYKSKSFKNEYEKKLRWYDDVIKPFREVLKYK